MFGGFSASKLKPNLKMGVSRIQIASNKKAALLKQNMREIAVMLDEDPPKEEKAKIRAEALIRDDNLIEAYEILQLECELLFERVKLIECSKECPPDLVSVISDVIWASQRVDIPELMTIRKQFRAKYGKKFEEAALENRGGVLNDRIVSKLSVDPPAAYLVQTYLERICEQFQVDWEPKYKLSSTALVQPMAAPDGYSVPVAQGTGLGPVATPVVPSMTPVTGQIHTDQEVHYSKQDYANNQTGQPAQPFPPGIPTATAQPVIPPPAPQQQPQNSVNDFEEVDIFVPPGAPTTTPGAPSAPPGSGAPSPLTMNGVEDKRKDDDNNDGGAGAGGGAASGDGGTNYSSSYADLAARFEQLKK